MQRQWIDYTKSLFLEVTPQHTHNLSIILHTMFVCFCFLFFLRFWLVDLLLGCFLFLICFLMMVREGLPGWSVSATSAASRWEQPWLCGRSCLSLLWRFWKASQRSHLCPVSTITIIPLSFSFLPQFLHSLFHGCHQGFKYPSFALWFRRVCWYHTTSQTNAADAVPVMVANN